MGDILKKYGLINYLTLRINTIVKGDYELQYIISKIKEGLKGRQTLDYNPFN